MSCLALNASYEPLMIVPARRAIRLVLEDKAEVIEACGTRAFRSVSDRYPFPLVIRLVRYVHVPKKFRRQVTNTFLFARDGYRCQYCSRPKQALRNREFLTRDHVVPVSRGGGNAWDNVVTACSTCNHRKGDRLPAEAGFRLATQPSEPNHVQLVWAVRKVTPTQAKYIRLFFGEDWEPWKATEPQGAA
ncbi:MAG: HNH endonuclease [Longimicrobiales bacterium]